jgi:hypothetical protein
METAVFLRNISAGLLGKGSVFSVMTEANA